MKIKLLTLCVIVTCLVSCIFSNETPSNKSVANMTEGLWLSADSKVTMLDTSFVYFNKGYNCFMFYENGVLKDSLIVEEILDMSYENRTKVLQIKDGSVYGKVYSFKRLDRDMAIGEALIVKGPASHSSKLNDAEEVIFHRIKLPFYN